MTSHSFDIDIAAKYGSVDLAIMIHHFEHWIRINKKLKRNFKEERTWTYQTREEIAAHFPYWNSNQVRRMTDKLVQLGVLRKGNFNRSSIDKTIWYAFENEEMFTIGNFANSIGNFANPCDENAKAIPHSKPHSKTEDILDLGQKTSACSKKNEKTLDVAKRWNLTELQFDAFVWLKSKEIDAEDKKLAYWAKIHSLERLIDVYNEAIHNKARSLRMYMGKLLDENKTVFNARIKANADFAKDFAKSNGWGSLKINKKYLTFMLGGDKQEINLDMESHEFMRRLTEKFEYVEKYG